MLVYLPNAARHVVLVAVSLVMASQTATADVGFLLPNTFHTDERGRITAVASFSDRFPGVEYPLRSDDFHIVTPDGEKRSFGRIQKLEQMTVLHAVLDTPGVYRLSSGERLGRKGKATRLDGAFVRLGEDGIDHVALPDGAPILTSQTATVSRSMYDTPKQNCQQRWRRLADSPSACRLAKKGFRDSVPIRVSVSFDGAPLVGAEIALIPPYSTYTDRPEGFTNVLDKNGETEISSEKTGPHVVLVRHIAKAPAGAQTDVRSYSTTLVFEIFPERLTPIVRN